MGYCPGPCLGSVSEFFSSLAQAKSLAPAPSRPSPPRGSPENRDDSDWAVLRSPQRPPQHRHSFDMVCSAKCAPGNASVPEMERSPAMICNPADSRGQPLGQLCLHGPSYGNTFRTGKSIIVALRGAKGDCSLPPILTGVLCVDLEDRPRFRPRPRGAGNSARDGRADTDARLGSRKRPPRVRCTRGSLPVGHEIPPYTGPRRTP